MIISDTAVSKRVAVAVLAVIVLVIGTSCYLRLPRESEPDITIPYVFVQTNYRGVSAGDIETSITREIEKKIKGLAGVKQVRSISSEGSSAISIEFVTGTDIDDALQDVRNKVDEAKNELPGDLEDDPTVFEVNFSEMPIVIFSLSGTCGSACLKKIADDLEEDFEAVTGVLEVSVTGAREREVRVEILADKLAYYGIPIAALQAVVASENQNLSGGVIRLGDGRFQLRVPGEFDSPQEIFGLVVDTVDGEPIYLRDVARVVDGFADETTRSRLNGREAINLAVKKRAGENIIRISRELEQVVAEQQPGWPEGTEITRVMNKENDIRLMVADLENNILSGLALVILVMLFALGLRNAILVSLSIPFSMLISFAVLYVMGVTLNMVVLFSLTLALGMLVDNAIVIIENIYRYMEQGVERVEAAKRATSEVAWPVIGATATTLAAFSPMLFWPGIMGEFMSYLPLTLIVTLSSSLFVAMVINPALAAFFMRLKEGAAPVGQQQDFTAGEKPVRMDTPLFRLYATLMRGVLRHRPAVMVISLTLLVIMVQIWLLAVGIKRPLEFFPHIDPKSMYVNVDVPEGASLEYIDQLLMQTEMLINGVSREELNDPALGTDQLYTRSYHLQEHPSRGGGSYRGPSDLDNVRYLYSKAVAVASGGQAFEPTTPNNLGIRFIDLEERQVPTTETVEQIRRRVSGLAGGKVTVAEAEEGPPTGAPINIEIAGDDLTVLGRIAGEIRGVLETIPHVEDIRDDYVAGKPTFRLKIDRQRAALFGLTTSMIGNAIKTGYNGLEVSTYREADEDYDIVVRLPKPDREEIGMLHDLLIPSPTGKLVPLRTVAAIDYVGGLGDITRIDYRRVVTVKAGVNETVVPGPVARMEAEKMLAGLTLPPGYDVKFTGEFEFQKESEEFLSQAFMVALFLIFLILVTMFNSVGQPFIIMTAVLLSLGGAFLGLTVIRSPFGIIMTGVGVISLAGIVVNNGIVLIDYINKLRERGYELEEAVLAGGATRLRPVLLTALTTILGLTPMVTGVSYDFHNWRISWISESSQWWQSMAIVVIFGLLVATFLTLVVVPALYSTLFSLHQRAAELTATIRRLYWRPYERLTGRRGH